jgi:hypothetical protein
MKREAVTIRFPAELVRKAKQLKDGGELFNELVVGALEQEVKRRQAWAAHQSVIARRAEIKAKTGTHPDSTPLIRSLREGEGRGE